MPIYLYKCQNCNAKKEIVKPLKDLDKEELCCNLPMQRIIPPLTIRDDSLIRGWWEHIAPEPIYIESRQHLREVCKKYGVYSKYLESGYNR